MKIIVDVMGGDNAPLETVKGAFWAAKEFSDTEFVLIGDKPRIEEIAKENEFDLGRVEIVHADEVITMEDNPVLVVRGKQNSSMSIGLKMLAEGQGDAFVSTGNTGALFTGANLIVRKLKGVLRPGIGAIIPFENPVLLMDTGANVTVTEENLEQFGVMGAAYMRKIYGIENPRVGLLNNGSEECKGTELQQAAYKRLKANPDINFVGNIEGNSAAFGTCDVLVTDGFTGNIFLKSVEGLGKLLLGKIKGMFKSTLVTKLAALCMLKQVKVLKKQFDSSEHGGAPILGINKPVIKAHGSSNAKAFKNAIRQAIQCANSGMNEELAPAAQRYAERRKNERDLAKQEKTEA